MYPGSPGFDVVNGSLGNAEHMSDFCLRHAEVQEFTNCNDVVGGQLRMWTCLAFQCITIEDMVSMHHILFVGHPFKIPQ